MQKTSFFFPVLLSAALGLCSVPLSAASSEQPSPARSRLGMNLSGLVDWSTEHPFVDVFRLARPWISQRQGESWGQGPALDLDENGWVKSLEANCWVDTPMITAGHAPDGDYVCLYEGEGTIGFWGAGSSVRSREPGRIVVNVNGSEGGLFLKISQVDAENPVRNIRLLMPGHEATYREQPFTPAFLERWSGFNTLRFMDWMETNGSEQSEWADRPHPDRFTYADHGAPVEVMVDLCNRLGINPWFCIPHRATDDYVQRFAELVKRLLDSKLKVYVEYSNEVWNGQFAQHGYAEQRGQELGLGETSRPWEGAGMFHAQRSVEIFGIFESAFGGADRLVRVIAWQAASGSYWTDGIVLSHDEAWRHTDALAIAPYMTVLPSPGSSTLNSDTVATWTVEEILDYTETNALPKCVEWMQTQKQVADKYDLDLICYEAGQHLVGVGGGENNQTLTDKLIAANRHSRMGVLYAQYLDAWRGVGGGLMAIFSSVSSPSKWGSWGLLENAEQSGSPKFDAVLEWNATHARVLSVLNVSPPRGGIIPMQLTGDPHETYVVEVSEDLALWIPSETVVTDARATGALPVTPVNGSGQRFFRAYAP